MKYFFVFIWITCFSLCSRGADYLSPTALAVSGDGKNIFIACDTANRVLRFDTASKKVIHSISVPASPSGLVLSRDDAWLYVTCASPESQVCIIDTVKNKIAGTIPVGHTARSPVLSPDGRTLYVCNQFNNDVSVIDLASRHELRRAPVQREPMAAALTRDGKYLLVANHLSNTAADLQFVAANVSVLEVPSGRLVKELPLPAGSEMLKDLKVSPDGKYAAVTHIFCNYDLPTTRVDQGLINANAMTLIDLGRLEVLSTFLLDTPDSGAANPWGLAWSADGKVLAVAHAGTHEVSVINFPALIAGLPKDNRKSAWPTNESTAILKFVPHYEDEELNDGLPYLVGARQRVTLPTGDFVPRAIAIHDRTIYTANYLSDDLSEIDFANWPDQSAPLQASSLPLGHVKPMNLARKGELYFHDGRLCYQGWQSCSSCHPGDGRVDALNWDLATDGLGNPKNTRSILFDYKISAHAGDKLSLTNQMSGGTSAAAVRVAIKTLLFTNQPEAVALAMDEYLKSLKPVPSPYLVHGRLSAAAQRGKKLFVQANCTNCHLPGLFADGRPHRIGTETYADGPNPQFYTPSLIEAWRTAPYLHTGTAATIRDVLTDANPRDGRHGDVANLSDRQIDDLCAYVLSL